MLARCDPFCSGSGPPPFPPTIFLYSWALSPVSPCSSTRHGAAYAGALVTKRLLGYPRPTGDVFAPAVALAMAIGRWGCFFTELPGTPTTLPWAVRFDGVPRHPSFLYESAFQAAMFCGLWWWGRPHVRVPGDLFKIYLLAYAIFRFLVEFVRGNDVVWAGLTRPQLFLIPATVALAVYFASQRVRGDDAALALHAGQP